METIAASLSNSTVGTEKSATNRPSEGDGVGFGVGVATVMTLTPRVVGAGVGNGEGSGVGPPPGAAVGDAVGRTVGVTVIMTTVGLRCRQLSKSPLNQMFLCFVAVAQEMMTFKSGALTNAVIPWTFET